MVEGTKLMTKRGRSAFRKRRIIVTCRRCVRDLGRVLVEQAFGVGEATGRLSRSSCAPQFQFQLMGLPAQRRPGDAQAIGGPGEIPLRATVMK